MKCWCVVMSIAIGIMIGFCITCRAEEALPVWAVGDSFSSKIVFSVAGDYAGGNFDLDFESTDAAFTVASIESVTASHGNQGTYTAYTVTYDGTITAEGTLELWEPLIFSGNVELRNGTVTGDYWIESASLATIRRVTHVTGEAWAFIFSNWQSIGSFEFDLTQEMDPPQNDFQFPLNLGDSWSASINQFIFGSITLDISLFGEIYQTILPVEASESLGLSFSIASTEQINGCTSYKTQISASGSSTTQNSWYCPERKWYSRLLLENLFYSSAGEEDDLRLNSYQLDVLSSHTYATPTPTPNPSPTPLPTIPLGMTLRISSQTFYPGDEFWLISYAHNYTGQPINNVNIFVFLDINTGDYWFWPTWVHFPPDIAFYNSNLLSGTRELVILEPFPWPSGAGSASGFKFWAAITDSGITSVIGEVDYVTFSYFD